mmetsp:Transcript_54574/g.129988  ORF Transcript_54574/g.129988 Transcript_54574/m.129988 type:complete len:221 (+) Transcript_54574:2922-3584(+)
MALRRLASCCIPTTTNASVSKKRSGRLSSVSGTSNTLSECGAWSGMPSLLVVLPISYITLPSLTVMRRIWLGTAPPPAVQHSRSVGRFLAPATKRQTATASDLRLLGLVRFWNSTSAPGLMSSVSIFFSWVQMWCPPASLMNPKCFPGSKSCQIPRNTRGGFGLSQRNRSRGPTSWKPHMIILWSYSLISASARVEDIPLRSVRTLLVTCWAFNRSSRIM